MELNSSVSSYRMAIRIQKNHERSINFVIDVGFIKRAMRGTTLAMGVSLNF